MAYRLFSKNAIAKIVLSTILASSGMSYGAMSFASTSPKDATLQKLVQEVTQMQTGMTNSGLAAVQAAENAAASAPDSQWASILYGTQTLNPADQNLVTFLRNLMPLLSFGQLESATSTTSSEVTAIQSDLHALDPTLTGTDAYNLFESFRTDFESGVQSVLGGTGSFETAFNNALVAAFNASTKFKNALANYNATPAALANIQPAFDTQDAALSAMASTRFKVVLPSPTPTQLNAGQSIPLKLVLQNMTEASLSVLNGAEVTAPVLTWTSSNPNAVTISNGTMTAKSLSSDTPVTINAVVGGLTVGSFSITVKAVPIVVTPPAAPSGLTHSNVTKDGWTESWSAVSGAASYNIYLNGTKVGNTSGTSYTFSGESKDTTYSVAVSAVSAAGLEGASAGDSVKTLNDNGQGNGGQGGNGGQAGNGGNGGQGGQGGNGGNGQDTGTNQVVNAVSTVVATVTATKDGGTVTKTSGSTTVQLNIPAGAFTTDEKVTVTTGIDTNTLNMQLNKMLPSNTASAGAFGVFFTGDPPKVPITLTITDPNLPANIQVYKVTDQGLTQVSASVSNGQVSISFSTDPFFVFVVPHTAPQGNGGNGGIDIGGGKFGNGPGSNPGSGQGNGSTIEVNGNKVGTVPSLAKNKTTYMPIWYVMHTLDRFGFHSKWDGKKWLLTAPKSAKPNFAKIAAGKGTMSIYLNGKLVQNVTGISAKDPSTGKMTTYMPIWYVQQVLKRVGIDSTWDGKVWNFKPQTTK